MKKAVLPGNNADCARYRVFKAVGRQNVPADLFPIHLVPREQIIASLR
jgi:hypothetical protein